MMRKALVLLIISLLALAGCSGEDAEDKAASGSGPQTGGQPQSLAHESASRADAAMPQAAQEREVVYWSLKEVRNLSALEQFRENVDQGTEDSLQIETAAKEGEPIVLDLHFDGERIGITSNVDSRERFYDAIVVSTRSHQHYAGEFVEYWAVSNGEPGQKELLLQIYHGN